MIVDEPKSTLHNLVRVLQQEFRGRGFHVQRLPNDWSLQGERYHLGVTLPERHEMLAMVSLCQSQTHLIIGAASSVMEWAPEPRTFYTSTLLAGLDDYVQELRAFAASLQRTVMTTQELPTTTASPEDPGTGQKPRSTATQHRAKH